ncbi:MAG: HAD family phosphatase [Chloroflexi bacterium]|nr:MAG: HAD family phosphatase [Chloroflexota bacterium]
MTTNSPKAIIFDMDGLLVDSEPVWAIAEEALLKSYGKQYDEDIQKQLIGLGTKEFLTRMAAAYGIDAPFETLRADVIRRMQVLIPQHVVPQPGAVELIKHTSQRGIPRAIASSSPMPVIEAVLSSLAWCDIFATRCSGEEVEHSKPAPDVYLLAAQRLGVAPSDCLALEDSPTGARAAVAAGMTCYAVPDLSHSTMSDFAEITPHVFASLHDVLNVLE